MSIDTQPSWTAAPPPDAIAAVLDAAEMAAVDDRSLAAVAICEHGIDARWKAIAAIGLLASLLRLRVVDANTLRAEFLRVAQATGASVYTTDAALEAIAMAEALERADLERVDAICRVSQVSVLDHAHCAAALAGRTIAACGGDTKAVFDRMRAAHGLSDGAV